MMETLGMALVQSVVFVILLGCALGALVFVLVPLAKDLVDLIVMLAQWRRGWAGPDRRRTRAGWRP